jgi:hypothetical protein
MLRIVQITEQLMQAHLKELESLGVKITADAQQPEQQSPQNPPIPQSKPASQSKPNLQQTGQQGAQQRPTTQQRQVV